MTIALLGGTVVKGDILSNSVYAGNPCKLICSVDEYLNKHDGLVEE